MVHELHKVGYQQIRIAPFIHDIGTWRCPITFARNIRTDLFDHRMKLIMIKPLSIHQHQAIPTLIGRMQKA